MNHFFIEKFQVPSVLEEITPPSVLTSMKPLLDKFDELLSIDVFLYSAMLKTKLINESRAFELVEIESKVIKDVIKNNPTNHERWLKKNKKALKLLIDHYNNLLDIPFDKSALKELDDTLWTLNVDVGQIYLILSLIHTVIPLSMFGGINLTKALAKVFNDEKNRRETEGLYV